MSATQGEHTFEDDLLVSGEELRSYNAASDLVRGEPVGLSGTLEVDSSGAGEGNFIGVNMYDVASGEEASVAGDDCEVRVPVSEAVSAGDELLPDGAGNFETVATSAGSAGVAIAQDSGGSGDYVLAYIFAVQGATA